MLMIEDMKERNMNRYVQQAQVVWSITDSERIGEATEWCERVVDDMLRDLLPRLVHRWRKQEVSFTRRAWKSLGKIEGEFCSQIQTFYRNETIHEV